MIDSERICQTWKETHSYFSRLVTEAQDDPSGSGYAKLSRINDYAHFVLFWGQFEALVAEKAESIDGPFFRRLKLMPRLAPCVGRTKAEWAEIEEFYEWRCDLAHGRISDLPNLVLPSAFDRIDEISRAIRNDELGPDDPFADYFLREP